MPENWSAMTKDINFKLVKSNFIKAARTGIESVFDWDGEKISAKELILDKLLLSAEEGLYKLGINSDDIKNYLSVIEQRVSKDQTGSQWITDSYRSLSKRHGHNTAKQEIVAQMIDYQKQNLPVHSWDKQVSSYMLDLVDNKQIVYTAAHFMSTNIFAVKEDTSIDLVKAIFKWKNIHHLPVENKEGKLSGIITDGQIKKEMSGDKNIYAEDIMNKNVLSINGDTEIEEVKLVLLENNLSGIPVIRDEKLVGIITRNDIPNFL